MDNPYPVWAARWRVPLGFALAVAYLIFSQPTLMLLVAGGAIAFMGLLLRAFAAGYLEKSKSLATGGPYRCTRNPLYLGSFLLGSGFALAGGSVALGLAFVCFFLLIYWPVMQLEERFLRERFGEAYNRYAERVPLFFPVSRPAPAPGSRFEWERYRKNREYRVALGYAAGLVFLALKIKFQG